MKKYTCWKREDTKVKGAIEGTKEEVLVWMREQFSGLKFADVEDEDMLMPAWMFFYEGEIVSCLTKEGETIYLVELLDD